LQRLSDRRRVEDLSVRIDSDQSNALQLLLAHPHDGIDASVSDAQDDDARVGAMLRLLLSSLLDERRLADHYMSRAERSLDGASERVELPQAILLLEFAVHGDEHLIVVEGDRGDVSRQARAKDAIVDRTQDVPPAIP
jgi:hypothetical protein